MIEIREATAADLPALEDVLGGRDAFRHRPRLMLQDAGRASYLVAFEDGMPVGHLLLKWGGGTDVVVWEHLDVATCPEVEDLRVREDRRREGIGSALMAAAEARARASGYPRIGLGVGAGNEGARALYERRGYRDAGVPRYDVADPAVDADGDPSSRRETVLYLVKPLRHDIWAI